MSFEDDELPPDLVEADVPEPPQAERIVPITLLTGYLGSGKTTLLQYILTAEHGHRIAVCMNDFGDSTDIESTAMSFTKDGQDPDQPETAFLSLPNGCLCCSIKEPGIAAIENMITAQEESNKTGKGFDRVVVELTGVADPAEIAHSFWTNEEMGGTLRLDGVVCLVDSRNILEQLKEGEECQKQIAASDVVLLNKMDLVTEQEMEIIETHIHDINPTAMLKRTHRSVIDIDNIFEIGGYSVAATLKADQVMEKLGAQTEPGHGHHHAHEEQDHKAHLDGISSLVIPMPLVSSDTLNRLETFLQSVHWDSRFPQQTNGNNDTTDSFQILRSKGIFAVDSGATNSAASEPPSTPLWVLQGVRDIFELKELEGTSSQTSASETATNIPGGKLVVIGKKLGDGQLWKQMLSEHLGLSL